MTDVNSLPEELLLMIFSYISCDDLIKYVQKVCQKWRRVVREGGRLWKSFLYIPSYNEPADKIDKFLEVCPMVQEIYFSCFNKGVGIGRSIAKHCVHLRKLDFSSGKVVIPLVELGEILTKNINMESLGVYVQSNEEAKQIIDEIKNIKNLKILILSGSEDVKFPTQPLIKDFKLLESIKIDTSNFATEDLVLLLENMKEQLLNVSISGEFPDMVLVAIGGLLKVKYLYIEPKGTQNRIKTLSHLKKLKSLRYFYLLRYGQFCSDSRIFKSVITCEWNALQELILCISGCDDEPEKLEYLGDIFPDLKLLYLDYYSQTHNDIKALWCRKLVNLDTLILIGSFKIDDEFFSSLRYCQKLSFFRATEAKGVTDQSVDSIAMLKNLRWLEMIECPMTKAAKQRLRQLLPNISTFYITRHFM